MQTLRELPEGQYEVRTLLNEELEIVTSQLRKNL